VADAPLEVKHLTSCDVDLFDRVLVVGRSKSRNGHRSIPVDDAALSALARLSERATANGAGEPQPYIFPACENERIDAPKPQESWRTASRSLVKQTAKAAGDEAARAARSRGCAAEGSGSV
jgi:hypothetical protein